MAPGPADVTAADVKEPSGKPADLAFDTAYARAQFEAFEDPETGPWAFLENAGGSFLPRQVTEIFHTYLTRHKVQPYSPFGPSARATAAIERAYEAMAVLHNVPRECVHFGPSTSQNTYVLAQAVGAELVPGDEVIVTNQDHEANIGAWRRMAEAREGVILKEWQVNPETGLLNLEDLKSLLSERTKLVAVTHCSNVVGSVNDVSAIAAQVHSAGGLLAVDGVAHAPHAAIDLSELGADFYFYSLYKTFGPHQGFLYARPELAGRLPNQGHFFNAGSVSKRLTPAGPQHAEIAASAGIVDYLEALGAHHFGDDPGAERFERLARVFDLVHRQECALAEPILELLRGRGDVRLIGTDKMSERRAPTIAFVSKTKPSKEVLNTLLAHKICANASHFYAYRLVEALGLDPDDGVVRLSLLHYNSPEEVERALTALDEAL